MIFYSDSNLITNEDIQKLESIPTKMVNYYKKEERCYDYLILNDKQKSIFLKKILIWAETTFNIKLISYSENLYDSYIMNYKFNDFFARHKDNQYILNHIKIRKYVIGFHLNDDYSGGQYLFYHNNKTYSINNEPGLVYGVSADIEHEIKPIISGVRKSVILFIENDQIKRLNNKIII